MAFAGAFILKEEKKEWGVYFEAGHGKDWVIFALLINVA